jgi:hypothetical protein
MSKPLLSPLDHGGFVRALRRFGRNAAILAVGPTLALSLPVQDASAGAQSPVMVTNTGTLLQAEPAPLNSIAPVTLSLGSTVSTQSLEISARVSNISVLPALVTTSYEPVTHAPNSLVFDSGNSTTPFVAWPDQTSPFQEMTAAPEPSTWLAALFTLTLLAWNRRRRFLSRAIPLRCRS